MYQVTLKKKRKILRCNKIILLFYLTLFFHFNCLKKYKKKFIFQFILILLLNFQQLSFKNLLVNEIEILI